MASNLSNGTLRQLSCGTRRKVQAFNKVENASKLFVQKLFTSVSLLVILHRIPHYYAVFLGIGSVGTRAMTQLAWNHTKDWLRERTLIMRSPIACPMFARGKFKWISVERRRNA